MKTNETKESIQSDHTYEDDDDELDGPESPLRAVNLRTVDERSL